MMLALHLGADLPDESRILGFCFLPLRHRRPALECAQVIDEELAVEVVDLVLKTASEELGPGCFVLDAVLVGGADGHATGAVDIAIDVGYRETALFRFFIRTGRRDDLRTDQYAPGAIDIDDCQSLGASDLRVV